MSAKIKWSILGSFIQKSEHSVSNYIGNILFLFIQFPVFRRIRIEIMAAARSYTEPAGKALFLFRIIFQMPLSD